MEGLDAAGWLARAHELEQAAGRVRTERWASRQLDVDLVSYAQVTSDDPHLTLPHPGAHQRATVLLPWAAVDPDRAQDFMDRVRAARGAA